MSEEMVHASCVAFNGRAVLITGASGRGKSGLALELMALGARLVADDRVVLCRDGDQVIASAPAPIAGFIEARFVGLLNADPADPSAVALIVDLDQQEAERLPPHRQQNLLGISLPLLHNGGTRSFPAAILQYLRAGRRD